MKRKLLLAMLFVTSAIGYNVNAQTDVTSTYLTNADFEGEKTIQQDLNGGDRCIYKPNGWTVTYSSGAQYDMTAMKEGDKAWNTFTTDPVCALPVNGGTQSYFMRFRWSGPTIKISQTTSSALPAGTYRVSADAYRTGGNGTATLSAGGKSVTVDTRNRWANYSVIFTLTEATSIEISLTFTGSADKAVAGVDNFKIENITQGASDLSHDWTTTIANAGFELGTSGEYGSGQNHVYIPCGFTMNCVMDGWRDGSINATNPSEGSKLYNLWAGTTTSLDLYQNLKLPAGKYTITADLRTEAGKISDQGVYAKIGDETFKSGTIQSIGSPWNGAEAWNNLSKDFYVQSDGTVQVGASSTGGASSVGWFQIDNFQLTYKGAVKNTPYSIAQGAATAITSDKWYAVTVPADGEYRIISSVDNTVYYTQNGYYAPSDAESIAVTAGVKQVVNLTAGTLYVRAANGANLTIEPDTYTYSVGGATLSVADGGYTQSQTFTVTFLSAATNDPAGEFQILDASKITVNGAAATASVTGKVLTITLADPLVASTDYAISVAAGAVGYKADAANDEITLTVHTPAVFDGHYYIKKDGEDLYFSRGGSENKQTVLDAFGVPVKITTDASNMSRIKFVDTGLLLGASGSSTMYWTDKGTGTPEQIDWTITKSGEKFKFYLMGMENAKKGMNIDGDAPKSDTEAKACTWELELPAAHPAKLQAVKDAQAATVATAMGFDGVTTQAQMKTYLETNYGETSIEITGTGGTNREAWQQTAPIEDPFEYAIFAEETVDNLKPGLYRLRVYGFERIAGGQAVYDAGGAAGLAYVYATSNSVTEKVKLASLFDVQSDTPWKAGNDLEFGGKYYANGQEGAQNAFNAGNYANDVYVKVVDEGEGKGSIKFGIKQPNAYYSSSSVHNNSQWICYNNFSLVRFVEKVTISEEADYTPTEMEADVTLTRTIKADTWNTFVVPFAINNTDLKAAFGADVSVAEYSEVADGDNSTVSFKTMETPAVAANTPVLLKTSTAGTSYTFPARTIVEGDAKVAGTNFDFVGNYNASLALVNGDYFISSDKLYKKGEGSTVTLKGTRAYIQPKSVGVKILNFVIDDEIVTGVDSVEAAEVEEGVLYNTAGQVVTEDYKGIVIKNGKKYLNK